MIGKFRRSMKNDKETKPHHISIPAKDPLAIVPPKKVCICTIKLRVDLEEVAISILVAKV
ncbi:hypothetical protein EJ05DRAFT_471938 [Pseudovirgaria hyperparasitica]|uniref:Uncharacterized protein n=1 Tax=Pseudovirgaria hyperparasitica TaxID=470096 RepID=A0A6A6WLD3_9PEZI|nr:uncharacterized protein EJ05DRAFT_471938 [Pseudovirgaria hyperparasitica]KAF2762982.1 hypothetical protein EJ05DRAFT_471938 [Pseudovirgaria hyperparasitica]